MLPGAGGIEMMGQIQETYGGPVIFLSVRRQDLGMARAFDMGPPTTWSSPSRRRS